MKRSILRWLAIQLLCLGAALAGYGAWTLVRGEFFQASSVVKNERPTPDISSISTTAIHSFSGEFEARANEMKFITSDEVLIPVVEKLELNRPAKSTSSVCDDLRRHIVVSPVRHTIFVKITVRDSSPEQAAKIANVIAEVYRDNRMAKMKQAYDAGIRALEERYTQSYAETKKASALVMHLRDELKVSITEQAGWSNRLQFATNAPPDDRVRELRPFDEARRDLEQADQLQKTWEKRIAMEKVDQTLPKYGVVTKISRAVPSKAPVFPSRSASQWFLLTGIALAAVGGLLLRR